MPSTLIQQPIGTLPENQPQGAAPLLSADEFEALQQAGEACELIDGVVHPLMSNTFLNSRVAFRIGYLIEAHAQTYKLPLWVACGEVGVFTQVEAPATARAADLAVISKERLPELPGTGFLRVMPELLVEIVSVSNTWTDTFEKIYEYFAGGADLVWIVDPAMKEIRVFTSPKENDLLRAKNDDVLTGDPVIPGFKVKVSEVFAV